MDSKLLAILRCPITKQKLSLLNKDDKQVLLNNINEGNIYFHDGSVVEEHPEDILVTENNHRFYLVLNGLPVMLEEKSIINE
jgi:Trm112p-like protein.